MAIWDVNFMEVLQEAKEILTQCFNKYAIDEVFLSFNGGKDCTVLLDITIKLLEEIYPQSDIKKLKVIYIRTSSSFPELETFIKDVKNHYGINLSEREGNMKEVLKSILEEDKKLKACLMGTRRTDPYSSNLKHMQITDSNWPQVMRVSPLLNWSYHEIWSYILKNHVPYCELYDKGYTSIGGTHNTLPNPSLRFTDSDGTIKYKPAYELVDGSFERNGRVVNNNQVDGKVIDKCQRSL